MRVLVVGLDGANLDLIKQWANDGKLPTFEKLMREGSYGYLESVIPTLTIPAWNCMTTGKNPAKIGCFSFIQKVYGSYDFRMYSSMVSKERDIWDILSDCEKEIFVLNAPNVQTAYKINGYMVAGCLCASEEKLTYPRNLRDELYNNIGYEKDITDLDTLQIISDSEHSRRHMEITDKDCEVTFHFMRKNWDFGFVVLTELDRVQHRFWEQEDMILRHYQNTDRNLKGLLDRLELDGESDETTVIIVSDHGFGPNKRLFFVNEWLMRKGLLAVRRTPVLGSIKILFSILKKPWISKMLRAPLMKFSPLRRLYQRMFLSTGRTPIIWDKTKAFSYAFGTIYINLEGREPQGIVKQEEYEQLRSEIIEGLKKISVKAYKREELYHGEYLDLAPDIVIQTDDNVNTISGRVFYGKEFRERFGGAHRINNGTFIAWGPNVKENVEIAPKMCDVAPTILHAFGIPIPKDMDGLVLKEIFKGEPATREIKYEKLEENKRIKKRIKELKYLGKIRQNEKCNPHNH